MKKNTKVLITGGAGFTIRAKACNSMSNKTVLVTGGAGFIGSHLTEALLNMGARVTVIDDLSEGRWENIPDNKNKNLKKIKASITDKNIGKYFRGVDYVFHLAALPRVQRSIKFPEKTHEVNVNGTLNCLLAARDAGVKKFVFSSSSSVYGKQTKLPLTEDMTPHPMSPYGLHKFIAEEYCKLFDSLWGLNTVSLRYFNVYGPRMYPNGAYATVLPKFINLMRKNKIPVINGDGKQSRDFTNVADVVDANIKAALSPVHGEVFNIGYGKSISVNKVVAILNKNLDKKIKPTHGPAVVEPKKTLASNAKARKMIGWKPTIGFESGIKSLIQI